MVAFARVLLTASFYQISKNNSSGMIQVASNIKYQIRWPSLGVDFVSLSCWTQRSGTRFPHQQSVEKLVFLTIHRVYLVCFSSMDISGSLVFGAHPLSSIDCWLDSQWFHVNNPPRKVEFPKSRPSLRDVNRWMRFRPAVPRRKWALKLATRTWNFRVCPLGSTR